MVMAQEPIVPHFATAYELIDAVNTYRSQRGLPAFSINSILMGTAQSQAEYMASTGTVTHTGPGGISFPDRLIAAGYSFVFRSENIISASPDASGWSLVTSPSWADDLHQHTMLSPDLIEIGAGVAISGGRGYYVIDCGGPGGGGSNILIRLCQVPPPSSAGGLRRLQSLSSQILQNQMVPSVMLYNRAKRSGPLPLRMKPRLSN